MEPNTYAVSKNVPDDLVFSVLSKLPPKSLKRFGCACKSWALLFEEPHFMNMFCNNFISRWHSYYDDTHLFLKNDGDEAGDMMYLVSGENMVKLDWPPLHDAVFVNTPILSLGSAVNGILCLYTYRGNHNKIVLWNPATQEFKFIAPASPDYNYHRYPLLYGFGYDQVINDYKVIQGSLFEEGHCMWEIYSLRSNSSRRPKALDNITPVFDTYPTGMDVYLNGTCHWLGGKLYERETRTYLVSFDLSNEVVLTTPLPIKCISGNIFQSNEVYTYSLSTRLVVLNGSIGFISNSEHATTTFHISVLNQLGVKGSWTKLFTVGPLPGVELCIGIGRKGDILFEIDEELAWFDLSTQMIKKVGVQCVNLCCQTVICKESHLPIGDCDYGY